MRGLLGTICRGKTIRGEDPAPVAGCHRHRDK